MNLLSVDALGAIFIDPAAYADPDAWHAAAARIRRESPVLKVAVDGFPEFWAVTTHADVMEVERNPEVFTNSPIPVLTPDSHVNAAAEAPVKTLIQMDGDEHKANRNVVNDWFKPGRVKLLTTIAKAAGKDLTMASFEKAGYGLRNATIPGSAAPVSFGPGRSYPLGPVIVVTYDPAKNVLDFANSAAGE